MKSLSFLCCLLFLVVACGSRSDNFSKAAEGPESAAYEMAMDDEAKEYDQIPGTQTTSAPPPQRKLIKTASLRFRVNDLKSTTGKMEALAKKYQGFVTAMNQENSSYSLENNMTIRVPADQLDAFIAEVQRESVYTDFVNITAQDVTEEFQDITIRLETKKTVRDRYIDILRTKAKTVEDILAAEEKIRVIQEEIESVEGRLKFLQNRTSLSTVNLQFYQPIEYVEGPKRPGKSFFSKIKSSFGEGWEFTQDLIIGLISIWPVILIIGVLLFFRRKIWNGLLRRKG